MRALLLRTHFHQRRYLLQLVGELVSFDRGLNYDTMTLNSLATGVRSINYCRYDDKRFKPTNLSASPPIDCTAGSAASQCGTQCGMTDHDGGVTGMRCFGSGGRTGLGSKLCTGKPDRASARRTRLALTTNTTNRPRAPRTGAPGPPELNATGQSRVTLSLLQERSRADPLHSESI